MEKDEKLVKIRHSLSHLMSMAVQELYPQVGLGVGPVIENGFYQDYDLAEAINPEILPKLEKRMRELIKKDIKFEQHNMDYAEALQLYKNDPYKTELINDLKTTGEKQVSFYKSDNFDNLCAGPHINSTKEIDPKAFKLDRIAGAYWRGDEKNKMLTRIYGLAFENKEKLDAYILQQEEARKRDHRKIGKELKLFTISDLVGAGLPLLQPRGMIIRKEIEDYLWDLHKDKGYDRVWTPHIAKKGLYETSGHAAKFGNELFRVKGGDEEFFMKPMNCPHHMQIFADNQFSYRDMPVRYFEPATVYRYEKAGQLSGLTRVRAITQDDGHLFCRVSQIGEEVSTIVSIIKSFYTTMGMMDGYKVSLSVRGDDKSKYLGSDEVWVQAEKTLEQAAKDNNLNYQIIRGEAAFYGPKLDFMFKDAIGREWQLATIQCDFNLPERFELEFVNEKGEKERPVVIHRAISGSIERFMGVMIEHFAGNFPLWLSPVQVKVIPVRTNHNEYAKQIFELLKENNVRVELDDAEANLGGKVRDAKNNKIPYWIVVGDKEIEVNKVTLESRDNGQLGQISKEELISKLLEEIKNKK
jgi:threonyl-tRNA synthetase